MREVEFAAELEEHCAPRVLNPWRLRVGVCGRDRVQGAHFDHRVSDGAQTKAVDRETCCRNCYDNDECVAAVSCCAVSAPSPSWSPAGRYCMVWPDSYSSNTSSAAQQGGRPWQCRMLLVTGCANLIGGGGRGADRNCFSLRLCRLSTTRCRCQRRAEAQSSTCVFCTTQPRGRARAANSSIPPQMGVNSISPAHLHARPVGRTCG